MNFKALFPFLLLYLAVAGCTRQLSSSEDINIDYGKVVSKTHIAPNQIPANAIIAGYHELARSNRGLDGYKKEQHLYRIELLDGAPINLVTEKDFFDKRDCVAVERGRYVNVRLMEDGYCQELQKTRDEKQQNRASQCQLAKQLLLIAQTDRERMSAGQQVENLCEYQRRP